MLERELARAERGQVPLSAIMADVDYFKRVNDSFGHPAGDAVLAHLASLLTASVRSSDVVARFGEPSTKGKLEGHTALVYKGDQAIAGTRQAQFLVRGDGVVSEINVFPAAQLDKDSVAGTYGKDPQKIFTDDFRPVWEEQQRKRK